MELSTAKTHLAEAEAAPAGDDAEDTARSDMDASPAPDSPWVCVRSTPPIGHAGGFS